ncbi:centromere-associated protein E-like [Ylistrum balloti]|uniref:centromere-associated protein E-like n=1 Tax=Ylistrum balloti TaxID=509963 RepID=UPI002905809C|nr:centromere-associated protein E-like [Ylistrum balloti]
MDLSWSRSEKADAPALVRNLQSELNKYIRLMKADVGKLENVNFAINEGTRTLRGILCKQCWKAVNSKHSELHSNSESSNKRKKVKKLSPEHQQLVDDLTDKFFKLERHQEEVSDDEDYCTLQEYHAQQMLELEKNYYKELKDLQNEMIEMQDGYEKKIQDKDNRIQNLQKQLESEMRGYKNERVHLESDLNTSKRTIDSLKRDLKRMQEQPGSNNSSSFFQRSFSNNKDAEIKRLKEDLCSKETANKQLQSRIDELLRKEGNLKERTDDQEKELCSLKESLSLKDAELQSTKSKLKELEKAKKKELVMGLCKERSGIGKTMVDMVTRELKRSVGGLLDRDNIDLSIKPCKGPTDNPNGPLFVLCLHMSRIGTNIQDAMEGIQAAKGVFVLVLHHTSKDNLSSLTPTSLRVSGSEYRQMGGIIDMAFSSDGGLYECELNDNAVEKIASIMKNQTGGLETDTTMAGIGSSNGDKFDEITVKAIRNEMTKYIRHLEATVGKLKRLPNLEDKYNELKNEIWHMVCKQCRSKTLYLSSEKLNKIGTAISHPLNETDTDRVDELNHEIKILRERIKKKDEKIEEMEEEKKATYKTCKRDYTKATKKKYDNEETQDEFQVQEDRKEALNEFNEENEEHSSNISEMSQLQTEKQASQNEKDSLNRTNEEMASIEEGLQREIDNLTRQLDDTKAELNTIKKKNEEYVRDISQLQTERQTLQDQTNSLRTTNEENSSVMRDLRLDIERLTTQFDQAQTELANVKNENEDKLSTMEGLQLDLVKLTRKLDETQAELTTIKKKNDEYVRDISQLQTEKQTLQDQTNSLRTTNEENSSVMRDLQLDIERLTTQFDQAQTELANVKNENEDKLSTMEGLQLDLVKLTRKLDENEAELSTVIKDSEEKSTTIDGLHRDMERLRGELDAMQTTLAAVQMKNMEYGSDISELETEKQTLQGQINSLNKTKEEMSFTMDGLHKDIERLKGNLEKTIAVLANVQKENDNYARDLVQLQTEKQTLQDHVLITIIYVSKAKKDEEFHKIKMELEECQRVKRKAVVMTLLRSSRSGLGKTMVDMVIKELTRYLEGRFDSNSTDISIVLCETSTNASKGPLFVLCLNMSRVGTNIQDALEGTKSHRDVYVLVLHHTNKDNLSEMTPTSLRVTGSELRQLGGIIDMAFTSENGLYECGLNNTAVDKIVTALKRY